VVYTVGEKPKGKVGPEKNRRGEGDRWDRGPGLFGEMKNNLDDFTIGTTGGAGGFWARRS